MRKMIDKVKNFKQFVNENYNVVLIAPNGKKSNLSKVQYDLVRSDNFKQWFGDWENNPNSQMLLDENGEPYILYHTGGEWVELDTNRGGLMFSFTSSSMAYSSEGGTTRPFFIKSDFIYKVKYEHRNSPKIYLKQNGKKQFPVYFVNAYGGFIIVHKPNQIKIADGSNITFDINNNNIKK